MKLGFVAASELYAKREELTYLLMEYVLEHSEGHTIIIEPRLYAALSVLGLDMGSSRSVSPMSLGAECDILISIGGDGTFLRAAKLVAGSTACILGVNAGRLGFLASQQPEDLRRNWRSILKHDFDTETRSLLSVYESPEDGEMIYLGEALNEISLVRRDTASMIEVETYVDSEYLANYVGDGLIISTPTGSTAYSMSVQGPIIDPSAKVHLVCPIAPHTLNMRPLILPDDVSISLVVESRNGSFLLASDGKARSFQHRTKLIVKKSIKTLRVAHLRDSLSFYSTLRTKLMWGRDVRK